MSDIWHDPLFLAAVKTGGAGGSVSGDIVTFNTPKAAPLKALTVAIDPVQDLHGFDSPWPSGGGKNKFNVTNVYDGMGYTFSDGVGSCSIGYGVGGRVIPYTDGISVTSGTTITISADVYLTSAESGTNKNIAVGAKSTFASGSYTKNDIQVSAFNTWQRISSTINAPGDTIWIGIQPRMDGYTVQFKNVQIELGSTATTYSPYSNICPISGWDGANVWRCGRNLCSVSSWSGHSGIAGTLDTPIPPNTTFTMSGLFSRDGAATNGCTILFGFADGTDSGWTSLTVNSGERKSATKTFSKEIVSVKFYASNNGWADSQNYTLTVEDFQLELGSTATPYTPYTGTTIPVTFTEAGTVYGGTWDMVNGVLMVTHETTLLPSTGWNYYSVSGKNTFNLVINGCKEQGTGLCDRYRWTDTIYIATQADKTFMFYRQNASTVKISICDNDYTDASAFGAAINGAQLVYELATPLTYTLTPAQLDTLAGANVVWGDTGAVSLEYAGGGVSKDMMLAAILHEARQA